MIKITDKPINTQEVIDLVASPQAGAIDVFIGTVRNTTQSKSVQRLEFEAYEAMAISEIRKIVDQTCERWSVQKMAVYHRKGILEIGDIAVVIAVSTPHRKDAFDACQFAIDTLKQTVPIWKKEVFEDGEEWVAAHP